MVNLSGNTLFDIEFNDGNRPVFKIVFSYEGASGMRPYETPAVVISSSFYDDIEAIREYLEIDESPRSRALIIEQFEKAFIRAYSGRRLDDLYHFTPIFVLQARGFEQIWEDIKVLLRYDGNSLFDDASSSLVKILTGIDNTQKLYDKLYDNPKEVMDLYDLINGKYTDIYMTLLSALCELHCVDNIYAAPRVIKSKSHKVTVNVTTGERPGLLIRNYDANNQPSNKDFMLGPNGTEFMEKLRVASLETSILNPLAMVWVENRDTKEVVCLPALYVKHINDRESWQRLAALAEFTITIISMIGALRLIVAGARGLILLIAVSDLTIGTVDLLIKNEAIKEALSQTEGGRWLLDNWNGITMIAGGVLLSTLLVKGILKAAPDVIASLVKRTESRELMDFYFRIYASAVVRIELRGTTKGTVRLITFSELKSYNRTGEWLRICREMEECGLTVVVGKETPIFTKQIARGFLSRQGMRSSTTSADRYSIIWKGEEVFSGSYAAIEGRLKDIFANGRRAAVKWLDDFFTGFSGLVKYGDTHLSNIAFQYRKGKLFYNSPGNVVVIKFRNKMGNTEIRIFETVEKVKIKGVKVENIHIEREALDELEAEGINLKKDVLELFSEFEPCSLSGFKCKSMLNKRIPSTKVSWAFLYPGDHADVAGKKIRAEQKQLRFFTIVKLFNEGYYDTK